MGSEESHKHAYTGIERETKRVLNKADQIKTMERTRAVCPCGDAKPWGAWYQV